MATELRGMMKKKNYFVLTGMVVMIMFACACSGRQKTDETSKDRDGASIEMAEPEPVAIFVDEFSEPLELSFYSGAGAWRTFLTLNPDGSFVGDYSDANVGELYICQFHGRFGTVEKLTGASWLLTLEELELDTGHSVGEEWEDTYGGDTVRCISSEPYGFTDGDGAALKPGAQFILYSPDSAGHEPGTELYGALDFQSWMHEHKEFSSDKDVLGCWGLQNMETGQGFFEDSHIE